MSHEILSLRGVTKRFGGVKALTDVTFDVRQQQVCAVIGPNGAGKSTLFSLVAGEHQPSTGQILLDQRDITGLRPHDVARLGVARSFQLVNLFESMTVEENVRVGAQDHSRVRLFTAASHWGHFRTRTLAERRRVATSLELFGIADLAHRNVSALSYGQQRLVAAARAIASNPKLLLLDEPAAGLSNTETETLVEAIGLIRSLGTTILLVEHNVEFVMRIAEKIVVLHFGQKIAEGTPSEIRASDAVAEAYLGV